MVGEDFNILDLIKETILRGNWEDVPRQRFHVRPLSYLYCKEEINVLLNF